MTRSIGKPNALFGWTILRHCSRVGLLCLVTIASPSVFSGCSDPLVCACTEVFALSLIDVTDVDGQPAVGLVITVTRVSDGEIVTPTSNHQTPGRYTVLSDGQLDFVAEGGTTFRVEGTLGSSSFSADYVFDTDSCRCHINKVLGPDQIQLAPVPES